MEAQLKKKTWFLGKTSSHCDDISDPGANKKRESGNNTDRSRFIQKIQMENVWTTGKRMDGGVLEFWMKKSDPLNELIVEMFKHFELYLLQSKTV